MVDITRRKLLIGGSAAVAAATALPAPAPVAAPVAVPDPAYDPFAYIEHHDAWCRWARDVSRDYVKQNLFHPYDQLHDGVIIRQVDSLDEGT